jgi:hypothetical protein
MITCKQSWFCSAIFVGGNIEVIQQYPCTMTLYEVSAVAVCYTERKLE